MTTLTRASTEWSSRRPDERFNSVQDLHLAACRDRDQSIASERDYKLSDFQIIPNGDAGLQIANTRSVGKPVDFTNWSFGQICREASAPAGYLKSLPATLAADCLNSGLQSAAEESDSKTLRVMTRKTRGADGYNYALRSVTSDQYSRLWNSTITERLLELESAGPWQPAPEAFDGSRGLYLGDRDLFAFMVDNNRRIFETSQDKGLSRGFFLSNSEVGAQSLRLTTFYYEYVCGNHRVWGAKNVIDRAVRHVGQHIEHKAFRDMVRDLTNYAEASSADDEARFARAKQLMLGTTRDDVLQTLFAKTSLTKSRIVEAIDLAETRFDWYGEPKSVWGMAGALTEIASHMPNANERAALEKATGKVMDLAF